MAIDNIAEIGIGGLLAITIIKTVLPYIKPAKSGSVGKELASELKPYIERQVNLMDRMNERDIVMHSKVCSNHDSLKDISTITHDTQSSLNAMHKRLDRHENRR